MIGESQELLNISSSSARIRTAGVVYARTGKNHLVVVPCTCVPEAFRVQLLASGNPVMASETCGFELASKSSFVEAKAIFVMVQPSGVHSGDDSFESITILVLHTTAVRNTL